MCDLEELSQECEILIIIVDCKEWSFSDGTPKGMKRVLEERNVSKMQAEDMRQALQSMPDFNYEKRQKWKPYF